MLVRGRSHVDCVNHWETGLCEVNSWLLPFLAYPLRTRCLQRPATANARRVPHVDCVTIWDCEAFAINTGFCALLSLLFFSRLSGSKRTPRSRCPLHNSARRDSAVRSTYPSCQAVGGFGFSPPARTKRRADRLSAIHPRSKSLMRCRKLLASAAAQPCVDLSERHICASTAGPCAYNKRRPRLCRSWVCHPFSTGRATSAPWLPGTPCHLWGRSYAGGAVCSAETLALCCP